MWKSNTNPRAASGNARQRSVAAATAAGAVRSVATRSTASAVPPRPSGATCDLSDAPAALAPLSTVRAAPSASPTCATDVCNTSFARQRFQPQTQAPLLGLPSNLCLTACGCIPDLCSTPLIETVCPNDHDPNEGAYVPDDLSVIGCPLVKPDTQQTGCRAATNGREFLMRFALGDVVREAICQSQPVETITPEVSDVDFSTLLGFPICQITSDGKCRNRPNDPGELRLASLDQLRKALFSAPSDQQVQDAVCRAPFFEDQPDCDNDSLVLCREPAAPSPAGASPPSGAGLFRIRLKDLRDSGCLLPTDVEVRQLLCSAPLEIPYVPTDDTTIFVCRGGSGSPTTSEPVVRVTPGEFLCTTLFEQSIGPEVFQETCFFPGGPQGCRPFRDGDPAPEILCCCHGSESTSRSALLNIRHTAVVLAGNGGHNLENDAGQKPTAQVFVDTQTTPPTLRFCGLLTPNDEPLGDARTVQFKMEAICPLTGLARPFTLCARGDRRTWYVSLDPSKSGNDANLSLEAGQSYGFGWDRPNNNLGFVLDVLAQPGDQVWVQAGTYVNEWMPEQFGVPAPFLIAPGVDVYGGFRGFETNLCDRNSVANVTILDGFAGVLGSPASPTSPASSLAGYSNHVVGFANSTTVVNSLPSLLDGFLIRRGRAGGDIQTARGGGVLVDTQRDNVTLRNLVFRDNHAQDGGGAIAAGDGRNLQIINCFFGRLDDTSSPGPSENNTAGTVKSTGGVNVTARGGAIEVFGGGNATVHIERCFFIDCVSEGVGGCVALADVDQAIVERSIFEFNQARKAGGAIYVTQSQGTGQRDFVLRNSELNLNWTREGTGQGGPPGGGAVAIVNQNAGIIEADIVNCLFETNACVHPDPALTPEPDDTFGGGGALFVHGKVPRVDVQLCTFYSNCASFTGGAIMAEAEAATTPTVICSNTIFWKNGLCDFTNTFDSFVASVLPTMPANSDLYTCFPTPTSWGGAVQDLLSVVNTLYGAGMPVVRNPDPLFIFDPADPSTNVPNLRLQPDSPAIDTGLNQDISQQASILFIKITNETVETDLDGNRRVVQGRPTLQGGSATVDFGAYEFGFTSTRAAFPHTLAQNNVTLDGRTNQLQKCETNWGNLVADAILWSSINNPSGTQGAPAQVALISAGEIDIAQVLDVGPLSAQLLQTLFPFNHRVVVMDLTTEQLKNVLEAGVSGLNAGKVFLQVSGLQISYTTGQANIVTNNATPCQTVLSGGNRIRRIVLRVSPPFRVPDDVLVPLAPGSDPVIPPLPSVPASTVTDVVLVDNGVILQNISIRVATTDFVADNLYTLCPEKDPRETLCFNYSMATRDYIQSHLSSQISDSLGYSLTPSPASTEARIISLDGLC